MLRKLGKEAEGFLAFPVLLALSRRPLTTKELSHVLMVNRNTVRKRCKELEGAGYVVQRALDKRWILVVQLRALGVPEPNGVPGITMVGEPRQGPVGRVVVGPQEAVGEEQPVERESAPAPPQPEAPQGPSVAERVAVRFGVPRVIEELGVVSVGKVGSCYVCTIDTPLRYGQTLVCQKCAKVWKSVDVLMERV